MTASDHPLSGRFDFVRRAFVATVIVTLLATGFFLAYPDMDRALVDTLRDDSGLIPPASYYISNLRIALRWATFLFYATVGSIWLVALARRAAVLRLYPAEWFYVMFCGLVGPLLLVDGILKKAVGRPRPRMVAEFSEGFPYGLNMDFVAVFRSGGACPTNCSFVSGEVAAAVMIFASLMFVSDRWRIPLTTAVLIAWAISGYVRFRMLAHFPSDVLFAGLYMILLAAIIHWLMFSLLRWQKLYARAN